jgi:hypothetical protein
MGINNTLFTFLSVGSLLALHPKDISFVEADADALHDSALLRLLP